MESRRILLIEDCNTDAAIVEYAANKIGCSLERVTRIADVPESLEEFDLVVCDLNVCDSDADSTVQWLDQLNDRTHKLIVTGNEDVAIAGLAADCGVDWRPKCTPGQLACVLVHAIRSGIRNRRLLDELNNGIESIRSDLQLQDA